MSWQDDLRYDWLKDCGRRSREYETSYWRRTLECEEPQDEDPMLVLAPFVVLGLLLLAWLVH